MAELRFRVDLFCEDGAHEDCGRALIGRCARERGVAVTTTARSARAGLPRAKSELRVFQRTVSRGGGVVPDLLVVLADANDVGAAARRRELAAVVDSTIFPAVVIGTPDPPRRAMAARRSSVILGTLWCRARAPGRRRRDAWKTRLEHALTAAGELLIHRGSEFATEIFDVMDFYRAGRQAPELQAFTDELRGAFRLLAQARGV